MLIVPSSFAAAMALEGTLTESDPEEFGNPELIGLQYLSIDTGSARGQRKFYFKSN